MDDFRLTESGPDKPMPEFDRRRAADPLVEMLLHKVGGMEARITQLFTERIDELRKELRQELHNELKNLVPDGDVAGHKLAHEIMIKNATRWEGFKYSVLEHITKTVMLAFLIYLGVSMFEYFRRSL